MSLERLEEVDVAKYHFRQVRWQRFPAGFASLIYRRSGGNALFMVTILQDIVKKGLLAQINGKWTLAAPIETVAQSVPETLDQLIDAQFQQLSAVEQRISKKRQHLPENDFLRGPLALRRKSIPARLKMLCW